MTLLEKSNLELQKLFRESGSAKIEYQKIFFQILSYFAGYLLVAD